MTSRIERLARQDRADAVEAERDAAMRRRAVLERFEEEAEAVLRVLVADAEQPEHRGSGSRVVDTNAAAAELPAVEHDVVGLGEHVRPGRLSSGANPLRAAR